MDVSKGGYFIKIIVILTVIILSFFIASFDYMDVGGTTVGVVSMDIPVNVNRGARTLMLKSAVNTVTFGGEIEYSDDNLTVVAGYCPLFGRIKGLGSNIQAAARSGENGINIVIGVPALPPESY